MKVHIFAAGIEPAGPIRSTVFKTIVFTISRCNEQSRYLYFVVPPGLEPGLSEPKSDVTTITPWDNSIMSKYHFLNLFLPLNHPLSKYKSNSSFLMAIQEFNL